MWLNKLLGCHVARLSPYPWEKKILICQFFNLSNLSNLFFLLKKKPHLFLTNKSLVYFSSAYKRVLAHLLSFQWAEWEQFFIENTRLMGEY